MDYQTTIQTLNEIYDALIAENTELQETIQRYAEHLEVHKHLLARKDYDPVIEKAKSENIPVDLWIRKCILLGLQQESQTVRIDTKLYDKLKELAAARGVNIDLLLTRSSFTEFMLNAINAGRV